jgi:hypothetical protein
MAKFGEVHPACGVDEESAWMMVPLDGYNLVLLRDGDGLRLDFDGRLVEVREVKGPHGSGFRRAVAVARRECGTKGPEARECREEVGEAAAAFVGDALEVAARAGARLFLVAGRRKGATELRAENARGHALATLDVAVKRRREVKVAFNFVKHQPAGSGRAVAHSLVRNPSQTPHLVAGMNRILGPQANVWVRAHRAAWVEVGLDLGPVVWQVTDRPYARNEWADVVARGDPTAEVNAFFVRELEIDDSPNRDDVAGANTGSDILVEDQFRHGRTAAMVLAHELGHYLNRLRNVVGHSSHGNWLMDDASTGVVIPRRHANWFNPT